MLVRDTETPEADLPRAAAAIMAHLAPRAFGLASGCVLGLLAMLVTVLVISAGDSGATSLPGYTLSPGGVLVAGLYGFVVGLVLGYLLARLRNGLVDLYLRFVWSRSQHHVASDVLDRIS